MKGKSRESARTSEAHAEARLGLTPKIPLRRAPVGHGLRLPRPAMAFVFSFGFCFGQALASGMAWAGLCLIHHHHGFLVLAGSFQFGTVWAGSRLNAFIHPRSMAHARLLLR